MDTRKLASYQHKHARPVHLAIGDNYEKVATMKMDDQWKDTHLAAELVRRWNAYPDLLDALTKAVECLSTCIDDLQAAGMKEAAQCVIDDRNAYRAAIAKATQP